MGISIQFGSLAWPAPGWLWHMLAFIGVWTAALFAVQAKTLISPQDGLPKFARWAPRIRLMIDVCFTTSVSMFIPPLGLVVVSVIAFFAHLGLMAHFQYFRRPVSALSIYHNWREGAKASSHSVSACTKRNVLLLGCPLFVQVALLLTMPDPGVSREMLWMIGGAAAAGYLVLIALTCWKDPLKMILKTRGIGRLGMIRGYFVTWLAEFYYLGKREVLESAIQQRHISSDSLTPIEASIAIRPKLVIVQAESLDFNVLGFKVDGQEVTPFLNGLRERSLSYRIAAARFIGSADADFVMLNGVMPSLHIITYNIPNYPYRSTLAQFLAQFGYRTSVFHGNTGNFYNRRSAFERMGFAKIYFEEELVEQGGLPQIGWGIEDKQVLGYSARLLRQEQDRACHFVITLTTHTPYRLIDGEREVFVNPQTIAQHYLNNMRYLDNQLRAYIGSLKSATVVLYSDHPADPKVGPEFVPSYEGSREFVPCLIHDTEVDLGPLQRSRESGRADDGSLTLLDIASYLRAQIAEANGHAPPVVVNKSGGWRLAIEK